MLRKSRREGWSLRHREEQEAYCRRFVTPVIAEVESRQLGRLHFAKVLKAAPTASVAVHLRRCLTAMVAAGLEEGTGPARAGVTVREWRPATLAEGGPALHASPRGSASAVPADRTQRGSYPVEREIPLPVSPSFPQPRGP